MVQSISILRYHLLMYLIMFMVSLDRLTAKIRDYLDLNTSWVTMQKDI